MKSVLTTALVLALSSLQAGAQQTTPDQMQVMPTPKTDVVVQPISPEQDLLAQKKAMRLKFNQTRDAYRDARLALQIKNKALVYAQARNNTVLVPQLRAERQPLKAAYDKVRADWLSTKTQWQALETQIKTLSPAQ